MRPARARILDAAEHLMGSIGLVRATTKEIARAAGCSEAALYKHFASKEEIFVRVLEERLPALPTLLAELSAGPAGRPVHECLADVVRRASLFYERSMLIGSSLFAEPALLRRHREALAALDTGPHKPLEALAGYLRAEQRTGRVRADADADAAAAMLLGACYQRAFLRHFHDREPDVPLDDFADRLARTALAGLGPV